MLQRATAQPTEPFRSSGSLRADLLEFLEDMTDFLRTPFGDAARGVLGEGDLAAQISVLDGVPIVAVVAEIVDQALGRGELASRPPAL